MRTDRQLFEWLCQQSVDGVAGVYRLHAGTPKKKAVVLIGTHGKEISSGLSIARWVEEHPEFFVDCSLTVAIGNIDAARLSMDALCGNWDKFRFTPGGQDMNRLPADLSQLSIETPEGRRALELIKVLGGSDVILDIHSTDGESQPAGLGIVGDSSDVFRDIAAVKTIYMDVCKVQASQGTMTRPHSAIFGAPLAMEVEVGQTGSAEAMETGLDVFKDWACHFGLMNWTPQAPTPKAVYQVIDSIMVPDTTFRVVDERLFKEHVVVKAGEVLLRSSDDRTVAARFDGELIWCPDEFGFEERHLRTEVWFQVQRIEQ